jgi:hypothetical protein
MPASGECGGAVERCVVGSGRVAPEAGSESSEPPHAASATESGITARTARGHGAPDCRSDSTRSKLREDALLAIAPVYGVGPKLAEEVVRTTVARAAAPFRRADGSFRFENYFRYLIAGVS